MSGKANEKSPETSVKTDEIARMVPVSELLIYFYKFVEAGIWGTFGSRRDQMGQEFVS